MPTTYADATLVVHLDRISHNYRLLREKSRPAECAAVVKANAYGLGVVEVAKNLFYSGCRRFFVAHLDEAIELQETAPNAEIIVFHGVNERNKKEFAHYGFVPVLNDIYQIELWHQWATTLEKKLPALLHIDTGMNRLGISLSTLKEMIEKRRNFSGIEMLVLMSHLACAEIPDHPLNGQQRALFEEARALLPALPASLANSSGIFLGSPYHYQLTRPGCALYGVNPIPSAANPMRPVISLLTRILQIREIDREQPVGYGASVTVKAGTRIATISAGYADGYLRALSNRGVVYFQGYHLPILGRVSMDLSIIDVTPVPQELLYPGAEVELIGEHVTVDAVAERAGTIGYEILTGLGARYKRIYKGGF